MSGGEGSRGEYSLWSQARREVHAGGWGALEGMRRRDREGGWAGARGAAELLGAFSAGRGGGGGGQVPGSLCEQGRE